MRNIKEHKGVQTLLGDPKKAIVKLSIPMIIAMSTHSLYTLTDRIWVSGSHEYALSATGYFFPFMMLAIALSMGLGSGGGSAISRRIGAQDKAGANSVAVHTLIFTGLFALAYMAPFLLLAEYIFSAMGASDALAQTLEYARIMFAGSIFLFFSQVANVLLRSEGNAKRAMIAILIGTLLNIVLDPFFIYTFVLPLPFGLSLEVGLDMGVGGAALATVISMGISSLFLVYWLFIKRDTYVDFKIKRFRFRKIIIGDIFRVALPATLSQASMSIMMFILMSILSYIGDDKAVGVFNAGWSIVMIAILPLLGIATAVMSVCGASFGAREYHKLNTAYMYAVKLGFIIELILAFFTFLGAPYISLLFTWSPKTTHFARDITQLLRIMWLFYPAVVGGMLSSSMFQGVGKGFNALVITVIRTIILTTLFAFVFSIILNWGVTGIYWGLIIGSWAASIIAFIWSRTFIKSQRWLLPTTQKLKGK